MAKFQYRNPVLLPDGRIDCEVKFLPPSPLAPYDWMPYTADPNDPDPKAIGRELHASALVDKKLNKTSGMAQATLDKARDMRARRDRLLAASDWSQLPDVPESTRNVWVPYRQALRDVTRQPGFPETVAWPERPV